MDALEITVSAPVVSFRDPLYATAQVCLPCPPPSTVGGMLAAAAGGWETIDTQLRFAMSFVALGAGTDLETYHPLDVGKPGGRGDPVPRERPFLADVELTVWLLDDTDTWAERMQRPIWPLRLGRSQDLVRVVARLVRLRHGVGRQGHAVVPADVTRHGRLVQLTTTISRDRARRRWEAYRYQPSGLGGDPLTGGLVTEHGQAVALLPPTHPVHAEPLASR
ncbi:CRISPR-associated protein Cas5 [Protofrankia coriariae]|uniref:CRISPR-associated protein Cas5 n=1 Tax=Protofrankia coriariae TaxID=1562887 RepID=A0ABR5F480_9ACTN|nr:CRISPR-associated protein Cas5 [Protofrankia coriariae]